MVNDEMIDAALMALEGQGSRWLGGYSHEDDRDLVRRALAYAQQHDPTYQAARTVLNTAPASTGAFAAALHRLSQELA